MNTLKACHSKDAKTLHQARYWKLYAIPNDGVEFDDCHCYWIRAESPQAAAQFWLNEAAYGRRPDEVTVQPLHAFDVADDASERLVDYLEEDFGEGDDRWFTHDEPVFDISLKDREYLEAAFAAAIRAVAAFGNSHMQAMATDYGEAIKVPLTSLEIPQNAGGAL